MRVTALPSSLQRIAFLGRAAFEPHVPLQAPWAQTRFFPVDAGSAWAPAIDEARQWGANASVVFRPQDVTPDLAARLPGALRLGLIPAPLFDAGDLARLASNSGAEGRGFRWLTYPEWPPPPELSRLPVLQTLPLPVDTARLGPGPRLEQHRVLVADWARPPAPVLERLRALTPVEVLACEASPAQVSQALERAGVLLYASRDALGRFDALPLRALAHGLLLISNSAFPAEWYIEPEDEFLPRPEEQMARAVEHALRVPAPGRAVRIRASQKVREAFDASACFQRALHDASLLADPVAHLASLALADSVASAAGTRGRGSR